MKKLLATVMAISMCIIIMSCSSKNNDEVTGVFAHNNISLDEKFGSVSNIKLADNKVFLLGIYQNSDYSECAEIVKYEISSGLVTYTSFDEVNSPIEFAIYGDETMLAFAKYNDETGEESYHLVKYIGDERMWEKSLDEIISTEGVNAEDVHIESMQDKWCLAVGDTFLQLSNEGELNLSKKLPTNAEGLFSEMGVVHVYGHQYHYTYDLSSNNLTENNKWKNALEEVKDKKIFISEFGNLYYSTDFGLFCYDFENEEKNAILNWVNSGMTADSVSFLAIQSEEMMFYYGYDISGTEVFCCLTKTDVNFNNREIIKITYIEDGYNIIPIAAIKFNSMQNEYYVVCDEYKSAYLSEDYNKIITCLDRDIVNGEVGDIIVFEDISALHKYAARGVLEDIYTLKNKTLEKENIFDCVKSLCELDGKLYAIPREFKVETLIASATNPIISNNWTLGAYLEAVASIGEGTKMLKQTSRNGLLNILLPYVVTEFVDIESGSCTFDGEQFNEFLNYVKSLPGEETLEYENGKNYYISGEILLYETSIGCYADFAHSKSIYGSAESGKIIGYPSITGGVSNIVANQYFAINQKSSVKNGAVEFMEYLFSIESVVDENIGMHRIPSLKSTLHGWSESESKIYYYFYTDDLSTYNLSYDNPITVESEGVPGISVEVNDDMINEVNNFLDNLNVTTPISDTIIDIVYEEISAYCGGVRSSEDTSKIIQNRIGTYLSEQK